VIAPDLRAELEAALPGAIRFDVDASRLTSLRVGGVADALATPSDRASLAALLRICARRRLPRRVIGRGFNTIVRDEGVDGVLIQLSAFKRLEERPDGCLRVEAGVSHASLTRFCRERGLGGLEYGAGIPGSIGGWIAMNAGIPDRETQHVVRELEVMSPSGAKLRHLPRERLGFRYRALAGLAPGSVIVSALLAVTVSKREAVAAEIDRLLAKRQATQPLDVPSCGSVFKNPRGSYAGRLIEAAGLKGAKHGGAQISLLHANFIVNTGGARASDIERLIAHIRERVRDVHGITLEAEVRVIGEPA
jgi:UDP-N-acetylmuramate dehydrogenase